MEVENMDDKDEVLFVSAGNLEPWRRKPINAFAQRIRLIAAKKKVTATQ